jgi:hypothetical protein
MKSNFIIMLIHIIISTISTTENTFLSDYLYKRKKKIEN